MSDLGWSWVAAPYAVCSVFILAVAVSTALVRGDHVLRLGVIGAAITALPWSVCQTLAGCTDDPEVAARLLRLGQGPVAGVGPCLMLVLLGVSGQLERYKWVARVAGLVGFAFFMVCWTTDWVVPGAQRLPSGLFYIRPGPITGWHLSQLAIWLGVGVVLARRATPRHERKRLLRLLLGVLIIAAVGSLDTLLLYQVWGFYPIAWLSASTAAAIALYLVFRTDMLRPQGFDRGIATELVMFAIAGGTTGVLALVLGTENAVPLVAISALVWATCTGIAWARSEAQPVRMAGERELEQFLAQLAAFDSEDMIATRLTALWQRTVGMRVRALWWREGDSYLSAGGAQRAVDPAAAAWLVQRGEALSLTDLATMKVGPIRAHLEALGADGATLIVPLVDRDELIGFVEANYDKALRDTERGFVAESARAAARALTFVALARAAARAKDTAREVEIADALRLQASASRDAELGGWAVAAEYRTATPTTGAGWSAIELVDGRLALLATEAQAHGVAAALATAALTGAFASATSGTARVTLDEIVASMRASSEGVLRSGEPVAAFLAILDAKERSIEWACAGHPGAYVVGPIAMLDSGELPLGSASQSRAKATPIGAGMRAPEASLNVATRGRSPFPLDSLLVVASSALRGENDEAWQKRLREVAPASGRLASVLVETALRSGVPSEDLLAVVVRSR